VSPREIDRRRALGLFGAAGVGAVVFGACGSDGNGSDAAGTTTTEGATGAASTTGASSTTASGASAAKIGVEAFEGAASCTLTSEQTEGPYYIDVDKIRSDIREDREGTRLRVAARVLDVDGCTPVKDAVFEIWHCDAGGLYSGFEAASTGAGGPGGGGSSVTDKERYLRGAQVTDADGIAEIVTIWPGWYRGRTVHIHAKVQLNNSDALTTQLYFDEKLNSAVYARAPYASHTGRSTFNDDDGIYRSDTTLTVSEDGDGYLGVITIGIRA
jgi:protocatechuate 3,4-dioxygenase beta subunit